jgi:hypothetical protein
MKTILVMLVMAVSGCATTTGAVIASGAAVVADCGKESIKGIAADELGGVESDILQIDWATRLEADAIRLGVDTVACIIDHIVNRSRMDSKMAKSDRNASTKVGRGEEWLAKKQVKIVNGENSGN